jgi:hypothetical protein
MIGVPNEDRIKIAVMYVQGKAEFWWRGTGCNANVLPWDQFCRMVTDRFNTSSDYEIVGQFHNLKQMATVVDYVDRFEEMVSMVKRHNPALPDNDFISSFISGLKDHIQIMSNATNLQPCHKHNGMQGDWSRLLPVSKSSPTIIHKLKQLNKKAKIQNFQLQSLLS